MKQATLFAALASTLLSATSAFAALDIPPAFRGPLDRSAVFFQNVKVAVCPAGTDPRFSNNQLTCFKDVPHFSNSVCGNPAFSRAVSMTTGANGSERDVCASTTTADGRAIRSDTNLTQTRDVATCASGTTKLIHTSGTLCLRAGVSFGANANLASFVLGSDYTRATVTQERIFQNGTDFEFLPLDGTRGTHSYVQGFTVSQADEARFRLDQTAAGATDKYKRIEKVRVSPTLVNP
jgi:hypothetical protein